MRIEAAFQQKGHEVAEAAALFHGSMLEGRHQAGRNRGRKSHRLPAGLRLRTEWFWHAPTSGRSLAKSRRKLRCRFSRLVSVLRCLEQRVAFQQGETLFVVVEAALDVGSCRPALHGSTQQQLHQSAEGDAFFGGPGFERIDQRRIQGHIQLSSLRGRHRWFLKGEQVLSV